MSLERRIRRGARADAHELVAKTAEEMAESVFEEAMSRDNELFRGLKTSNPGLTTESLRRRFVRAQTPHLLEAAKSQLIDMLGRPDVAEDVKSRIYDAVLRDNALNRGAGSKILHH